jgi:hypothetical protein
MDIEGYENYLIYDDGRVQNKKTKRFLKQCKDGVGYYCINLYKNNKSKMFNIHRLVGLHYLESIEGKNVIDHIDRNKTNNHVSNLRWANHSENMINIGVRSNNILGIKHISKTKYNNYTFTLQRPNIYHSKTFKTLDEAIDYRDNYLANIN